MIGLDTNALLRLFIEDDADQCRRVREFVAEAAQEESCLVNAIVLSEFAWALAKRAKRPRAEVARLVEDVLSADDLDIAHRAAAKRALLSYRSGKAGFPDYFLAEINAELGCKSTMTFDVDALDSQSFSAVP